MRDGYGIKGGRYNHLIVQRVGKDPSRLTVLLFALAVILFAHAAIGRLSADGQNLLWLHVPLGVALVGLTETPSNESRWKGPRVPFAHD